MANDQLSEVLDQLDVRGVLSGGFAAKGRWVGRTEIVEDLKYFAIIRGRVRLTTDGIRAPLQLEAGDVAVLNSRSWFNLEGGEGGADPRIIPRPGGSFSYYCDADDPAADVVLGGRIDLNPAGRAFLLQALPPTAHVRGTSSTANLRGNLERLYAEVTGERIGGAFAIRQYAQLLILDVLRAHIDQSDLPAGWLKATTDEQLRPALALIHTEPGKPWRLEELARAASMSRTSFAERFRAVTGTPPLTYLSDWRMLLAKRALADGDARIGLLASRLGYGSDSAFSTAFKREVGESPLRYRARAQVELG